MGANLILPCQHPSLAAEARDHRRGCQSILHPAFLYSSVCASSSEIPLLLGNFGKAEWFYPVGRQLTKVVLLESTMDRYQTW